MMRNLFILVFILFSIGLFAQNEINPDGYNKFYYDNGRVSSEGFMKDGQPDGYWKTYYENGVIKSEGNRASFLLDSVWTFYDDKGKVAVQINYKEDKKNGIRRTFHENEIVEENFIDDIKQGYTYYYYPDKKLWKEISFVNGLEEGVGKEYTKADDRVIKLTYYTKGFITHIEYINRIDKANMKQGKWVYYYDDGVIKSEGQFKNDLKHGYFKEYDRTGNLISTTKYIDGILQEDVAELAKLDIKREYYSDGKVKIIASYKDDVPEGVRREFSPDGEVIAGYIFRNGKVIGEGIIDEEGIKDGPWKEFFPNGALKSAGVYDKGKKIGEWKFYHPNGQIEQTGYYNDDGKAENAWTWYYPLGDLLREETYFNGMIDGYSTEYDEFGVIIAEGEYIEDFKEGKWKYNYGDHSSEGDYLNGMRHGMWKIYYGDGTPNFEGKFIEDNPDGNHKWYWPNGNKKTEGNYIMGLKEGEWLKYNYDGSSFISIFYKNGVEKRYDGIRVHIYDEEGEENEEGDDF